MSGGVERYGLFELTVSSRSARPRAWFWQEGDRREIAGFIAGPGKAAVRFMPDKEGTWRYTVEADGGEVSGEFQCVPSTGRNHGPVRARGMHFCYADGTGFIPMGTTCYAWVHQDGRLMEQTLDTLRNAPFNKVRMCVFPKSTQFNANDPEHFPFERKGSGGWDVDKPDQAFWSNLENRVTQLGALGIEADLILFHPYDRWGFSSLSREENLGYIDYCVRRLSAYRNVWWSMANEYDLVFTKNLEEWDALGEAVHNGDPYGHLISVHNWLEPYPKRPWLTHVSWQGGDMQTAFKLRTRYGLPVIVDELGYEGNIEFDWGNLSAFELIDRMWAAAAFGCYSTHGETFYNEDEVLWWSKGGVLYGEAPKRIAFLREFMNSLPGPMEPLCAGVLDDPSSMAANPQHAELVRSIWDSKPQDIRDIFINEFIKPIGVHRDYMLIYLRRHCQSYYWLDLPQEGTYDVELLDAWEMRREKLMENVHGRVRVTLPGKEGVGIYVARKSGKELTAK